MRYRAVRQSSGGGRGPSWSRRTILKAGGWLAGAAALLGVEGARARPVGASVRAVTTEVRFPGAGGEIQAWVSRPREAGRYPAIVLLHGSVGVTDSFKDVGVRFAEEGIVGLAVNHFTFTDDPSDSPRTISGALDFLRSQEYVDANRVVLSGYCKGGGLTFLGLANGPGFAAGVIWHGQLFSPEADAPFSESPFDAAQRAEVPMLIVHGVSDRPVPIADVYRLTQRLDELGKDFELKVYSGTNHAFTLPGVGNYIPENADDAFREAVLFIRRRFGLPVGPVAPLVPWRCKRDHTRRARSGTAPPMDVFANWVRLLASLGILSRWSCPLEAGQHLCHPPVELLILVPAAEPDYDGLCAGGNEAVHPCGAAFSCPGEEAGTASHRFIRSSVVSLDKHPHIALGPIRILVNGERGIEAAV